MSEQLLTGMSQRAISTSPRQHGWHFTRAHCALSDSSRVKKLAHPAFVSSRNSTVFTVSKLLVREEFRILSISRTSRSYFELFTSCFTQILEFCLSFVPYLGDVSLGLLRSCICHTASGNSRSHNAGIFHFHLLVTDSHVKPAFSDTTATFCEYIVSQHSS